MREQNVEKVSTPPLVHDATQPSPEAVTATRPKPGVLVAVVGDPVDGAVPVYDAALGYCVWQTVASGSPVTSSDGLGGFEIVFDNDGNVVYAS